MSNNQFITVPGRALSSGQVVPSFMCGKYFSAIDAEGKVIVTEAAMPKVRISYTAAHKACADAGLALLTLAQSTALALDIASVAENWSGDAVGQGTLMQGLHLGTVRGAVDGVYVSPKESERRGFKMSNGEVIFDVAGHLYTWLFDDVQGDERGVVASKFADGSPAVSAPFPSGEQGMGWYPEAGDDWSGYALIRGGCWCSGSSAGVFYLSDGSPVDDSYYVGFRCTLPGGL